MKVTNYKVDNIDPEIQLLGIYSINKLVHISGSTLRISKTGNNLNVHY